MPDFLSCFFHDSKWSEGSSGLLADLMHVVTYWSDLSFSEIDISNWRLIKGAFQAKNKWIDPLDYPYSQALPYCFKKALTTLLSLILLCYTRSVWVFAIFYPSTQSLSVIDYESRGTAQSNTVGLMSKKRFAFQGR